MKRSPDFGPAMLAFFLRARAAHAWMSATRKGRFQAVASRERKRLGRLAKLTGRQMEFAWMGRLRNGVARTRLWAVLGHFPADYGLILDDAGGQRHG